MGAVWKSTANFLCQLLQYPSNRGIDQSHKQGILFQCTILMRLNRWKAMLHIQFLLRTITEEHELLFILFSLKRQEYFPSLLNWSGLSRFINDDGHQARSRICDICTNRNNFTLHCLLYLYLPAITCSTSFYYWFRNVLFVHVF